MTLVIGCTARNDRNEDLKKMDVDILCIIELK